MQRHYAIRHFGHARIQTSTKGLCGSPLPDEERAIVGRLIDHRERISEQLANPDKNLARKALEDPGATRLMTILEIWPIVATTVLALTGDILRFSTPEKLSSHFGLTPRIRRSGDRPARNGRIASQGIVAARTMFVEETWSARTIPGPLRASFVHVQQNPGAPAAPVATARKLEVMIWRVLASETEYAYAGARYENRKHFAAASPNNSCRSRLRATKLTKRLPW